MQIVIDITEKDYEKIRETSFVENTETMFKQSSEDRKGTMMLFRIIDAIKHGTPLPKGHGRIGDLDALENEMINGIKAGNLEEGYEEYANINNMNDCVQCVKYADIIIEADTESEDKE